MTQQPESDAQGYFTPPAGEPTEAGRMVTVESDLAPVELVPGLLARALVGRNLLASFVRYAPHAVAPRHAHVEEQLFVVLEGELELDLDGEVRQMRPGDAALIPSWVPHSARSLDRPAYQMDVFSPPRQALLRLLERAAD